MPVTERDGVTPLDEVLRLSACDGVEDHRVRVRSPGDSERAKLEQLHESVGESNGPLEGLRLGSSCSLRRSVRPGRYSVYSLQSDEKCAILAVVMDSLEMASHGHSTQNQNPQRSRPFVRLENPGQAIHRHSMYVHLLLLMKLECWFQKHGAVLCCLMQGSRACAELEPTLSPAGVYWCNLRLWRNHLTQGGRNEAA